MRSQRPLQTALWAILITLAWMQSGCSFHKQGAGSTPTGTLAAADAPAGPDTPLGKAITAARNEAPVLARTAESQTAASLPDLGAPPKGAGILICDPLVRGADADTALLGDGCSAWLHFTVGGLPQVGKTPLWTGRARARQEMGRQDLRLDWKGAKQVASLLGLTHIALSQIEGSASHATLYYSLFEVTSAKLVGAPIVTTGSAQQIVAALPGIAARMASLLNGPSLHLPALGISSQDLALLGQVGNDDKNGLTISQHNRVNQLAGKLPLAGIYAIDSADSRTERGQLATQLLAQAPENALAWGVVGENDSALLVEHGSQLNKLFHRYPGNYQFAACNAWLQRERPDRPAEETSAIASVRCAPTNPDGWLTLAATFSNAADDIRQGRTFDQLNEKEKPLLTGLYQQWLGAAAKAVNLDPLYGKAWLRLAEAACFHGEDPLADAAFWKAVELDPEKVDVYSWGLQMYTPKWMDDADRLAQVARLAAVENYDSASESLSAADDLKDAGFKSERQALLARTVARWQEAVRKYPDDPQNRYNLAQALKANGQAAEAIKALQDYLAVKPDDVSAHYDLANAFDQVNRTDDAIKEYRQVLRLDPDHDQGHYDLGSHLKNLGHNDEALHELQAAVRIDPDFADAHNALGEVFSAKGDRKNAIREFQKAVDLNPDFANPAISLCTALADDGQFSEAFAAGDKAVQAAPDDVRTHEALAYALEAGHQPQQAIDECDEALRLNPDDATAHENRGDALMDLGRKSEAQEEWKKVLALDHGDAANEAKKMLMEHP